MPGADAVRRIEKRASCDAIFFPLPIQKTRTDMAAVIELGGKKFARRFIQDGEIRFHIIDGGIGPTVVLIAGFPQTAYAWRRLQPLLYDSFRTIATI
jgi:hypothetical protein